MKPDLSQCWAVMTWDGLLTVDAQNRPRKVILRYLCKDAKPLVISKYVYTWMYFCEGTKTWDIHELSTGVRLCGAETMAKAIKEGYQYFEEMVKQGPKAEEFFFEQMKIMGPYTQHTVVSFGQAMEYLRVSTEMNLRLTTMRKLKGVL